MLLFNWSFYLVKVELRFLQKVFLKITPEVHKILPRFQFILFEVLEENFLKVRGIKLVLKYILMKEDSFKFFAVRSLLF